MVNSPSRLNSRPAAPLSPVECGGMTPLCHREARLPVDRVAHTHTPGAGTAPLPLSPARPSRNPRREIRYPVSQSRLIKANAKYLKSPSHIVTLRLPVFALKPRPCFPFCVFGVFRGYPPRFSLQNPFVFVKMKIYQESKRQMRVSCHCTPNRPSVGARHSWRFNVRQSNAPEQFESHSQFAR